MGDGSKKHVCVFTTLHTLPFQVFDSIGYNIAHRTLRCIVRLLRLDSIEIKLCISHFETTNGARGARYGFWRAVGVRRVRQLRAGRNGGS